MPSRIQRKLWHFGAGILFPILSFFLPRHILLPVIGLVTAVFLAGEIARFLSPRINQWFVGYLSFILKPQEGNKLTGSTYAIVGTLLAFLLFEPGIAAAAVLFMAVGDPVAATAGETIGRLRLRDKSLEGSLAFFLSALGVGIILTSAGVDLRLLAILVGAATASITEFLPLPLDDNLTIPVLGGGVMALLTL